MTSLSRSDASLSRGIYPGTFDPITLGHMDMIRRGLGLVDELIVAVAENPHKGAAFPLVERVEMVQADVAKGLDAAARARVKVMPFSTLLVGFARMQGATLILRGLRVMSDFEYEFQMAGMNARLAPDVETVFLMASEETQFITSSVIKEVSRLGGDVSTFVSAEVEAHLRRHWSLG